MKSCFLIITNYTGHVNRSYHTYSTVILFSVIVPVLSLAITVVEPKVSKHSSFLMNTLRAASLFAIIVKHDVTVIGRP